MVCLSFSLHLTTDKIEGQAYTHGLKPLREGSFTIPNYDIFLNCLERNEHSDALKVFNELFDSIRSTAIKHRQRKPVMIESNDDIDKVMENKLIKYVDKMNKLNREFESSLDDTIEDM